jgi:hypothetical protein
MRGALVPLVLIPRFTSYIGEGTFVTNAMDVSAYASMAVEFWRGPLLGSAPASFSATFEGSTDGVEWFNITPGGGAITGAGTTALYTLDPLTYRFLRISVVLVASDSDEAAITCWAAGNFELRLEGAG